MRYGLTALQLHSPFLETKYWENVWHSCSGSRSFQRNAFPAHLKGVRTYPNHAWKTSRNLQHNIPHFRQFSVHAQRPAPCTIYRNVPTQPSSLQILFSKGGDKVVFMSRTRLSTWPPPPTPAIITWSPTDQGQRKFSKLSRIQRKRPSPRQLVAYRSVETNWDKHSPLRRLLSRFISRNEASSASFCGMGPGRRW